MDICVEFESQMQYADYQEKLETLPHGSWDSYTSFFTWRVKPLESGEREICEDIYLLRICWFVLGLHTAATWRGEEKSADQACGEGNPGVQQCAGTGKRELVV